ncbi:MAG: CBS domain-containing protein [Burkholderiales bacterium]
MWRNDRDRPDDPRTQERETERLSRDEYERPRYGSPQSQYAERPGEPTVNDGALTLDQGRAAPQPHNAPTDARRVHAEAEAHAYAGQRTEPVRRLEQILVHELMTRRVASVNPASSVERAVRLMAECDCGALPVLADTGVLVGIVTDRDIALRIVGRGRDARTAIVADCMTDRVFACYANEPVAECMRQMAGHQVRRMPVVDDRGRLVGIVAQSDLARHAAHYPAQEEGRALTEVLGVVSEPTHKAYR